MTQSILDIFKQSGDDHIGQTLVRLARLAEARHQYEQASTLQSNVSINREDRLEVQGGTRAAAGSQSGQSHADQSSVHTEVIR